MAVCERAIKDAGLPEFTSQARSRWNACQGDPTSGHRIFLSRFAQEHIQLGQGLRSGSGPGSNDHRIKPSLPTEYPEYYAIACP